MKSTKTRFLTVLLLASVCGVHEANAGTVIETPQNADRLLLCGKANLNATNARLAADPADFALQSTTLLNRQFNAGLPDAMPNSYWRIGKGDAYVCLGANHFNDSTWTLPGYARTGAYDWFEVHVLGFKTDGQGNKIDVNGDGSTDDDDWTQIRYLDIYSGSNPLDSNLMADAFANTWQSRVAQGTVSLSNYDADGYPRNIDVATVNGAYFSGRMGQTNLSACPRAWQSCYVFGSYNGQYYTVAPTAQLNRQSIAFAHSSNRWLAYRPQFDSFTVSDPGLSQFLTTIQFEPTFWVQAKDAKIDYQIP